MASRYITSRAFFGRIGSTARFYSEGGETPTIFSKLREDMKANMRAKNMKQLALIKALLSSITYAEKDPKNKDIDLKNNDSAVIALLQAAILQREESIAEYAKINREDLVAAEQEQIDSISTYLPKQLTNDEITAAVTQVIQEQGAAGMKSMGNVIKAVKIDPTVANRARIVDIVKQLLSEKPK